MSFYFYYPGDIPEALKAARLNRKLSQRALSGKSGIPQSHISNIEKGAVDIKLSTLNELARALELEPVLVPRQQLPVISSIIHNTGIVTGDSDDVRIVKDGLRPAYSLDEDVV